RMTPASFDLEKAPVKVGYFIGDYEGLVAQGKNFGAFFSMPTATDSSSIFYRDPAPAGSGAEPPARAVPGELLIGFQPRRTRADIAGFYADHGLSELKNLDLGPDKGVRLVATPVPQARELIPALQRDPRVQYAEPNGILTFAQVPNDPTF